VLQLRNRQELGSRRARCPSANHQEQQTMASSPMAIWKSGFDAWRMLGEAQTVVALRMMGMAGMWPLAEGETLRMVTEKQQAFAQSAFDGTMAAMRGAPPDLVLSAMVRPLGLKTSANAKRLGRSYSKQFR
jgi:hypothetical protein